MKLFNKFITLGLVCYSSLLQATEPPIVILFGGVGSTSSAMQTCAGQNFRNIGYKGGAKKVKEIVKEIRSNPEQRYVVAGHSSGAKYSNRVGWNLKKSENKNVYFVSLDGYSPHDLQYRAKTQCWKATNGRKIRSKNAKYMTIDNCGTVMKYEAPHCQSQWCLHFSLVNTNVSSKLSAKTFVDRGYQNCQANLAWMNPWGDSQ